VPEGYVKDVEHLTEKVANETESLMFTVTEVGSEIKSVEVTYLVWEHDQKEKPKKIQSSIATLKRQKKEEIKNQIQELKQKIAERKKKRK